MSSDNSLTSRLEAAPPAHGRSGEIAFVLVAFLGGFASWPALVALGSLFDTLNGEFGWNRSQVTTAQLIFTIASVVTAPIVGPLIDRIGVRALVLLGLVLFPITLILIGSVDRSYAHWVGAWIAASLAGQLVAPSMFAAGVARRFTRHRGIALGFAACGLAAAYTVVPIVMVKLIAAGSWRYFYFGMAAFLLVILLPLTWLFYRDSDGVAQRGPVPAGMAAGTAGFRKDVLQSRHYWRILIIVFCVSFVVGGMVIHMQPLFRSHGLTAAAAASAVAFYGIGGVGGRLVGGWLLDRFDTNPLPALPMCAFPVLASLILIFGSGSYAVVALLLGIAGGVEVDVVPYLVRRYFPAGLFGTTYLSLAAVFVAGAGGSPFLVSLAYDITKSYDGFLIASVIMGIVASILLLLLGRYPDDDAQGRTAG